VTSTETRERALVQMTADLVILTVRDERLQVLLIERGNEPFRGQLALPGGFLRPGEDLPATAHRELREETQIDAPHLEEVGSFSKPDRDPRGPVISVAFLAIAPNLPTPVAGTDAAGARWTSVEEILSGSVRLAFDHNEITAAAVERAREKLEYTTLATQFCAKTFTIGELRTVYEVVWGTPIDPRNFHRKVLKTKHFVEPTGEMRNPPVGRPAKLFRAGSAEITQLYPAMLRRDEVDGSATDDQAP